MKETGAISRPVPPNRGDLRRAQVLQPPESSSDILRGSSLLAGAIFRIIADAPYRDFGIIPQFSGKCQVLFQKNSRQTDNFFSFLLRFFGQCSCCAHSGRTAARRAASLPRFFLNFCRQICYTSTGKSRFRRLSGGGQYAERMWSLMEGRSCHRDQKASCHERQAAEPKPGGFRSAAPCPAGGVRNPN